MSKVDLLNTKNKRTAESLDRLQSLPLEQKVNLSLRRIAKFHNYHRGNIFISFSGGKDSTVLLHLVRSIIPDAEAVFYNTGLEFPEICDFVNTVKNVKQIKPDMNFKTVLNKWGYPLPSKKHAENIYRYRTTKHKRIKEEIKNSTGIYRHMPKKWKFLLDAPFQCSHKCCDELKKKPSKAYVKKSGKYPIIGTMAYESRQRAVTWIEHGCNIYGKESRSNPIAFWVENDIWNYIKSRKINYSKIYDMGYTRTGCMFCMFGHFQDIENGNPNRFDLLKRTHEKQYNYCMNKLGLNEILTFVENKLYGTSLFERH